MRTVLALLATTSIAFAAPAMAAEPAEFEVQVQTDDLDLTTQDGVAMLDTRVKSIINRHCATGGRDGASIRVESECRQTALAAAEGQMRVAIAEARATQIRLASTKPVAPEA